MADPSGFHTQQPPADRRRGRFRRDADLAASAPHDGRAVGRRLHGDAAHQPRGRAGGRCARPGRIRRRPHPRREELAARSHRRARRRGRQAQGQAGDRVLRHRRSHSEGGSGAEEARLHAGGQPLRRPAGLAAGRPAGGKVTARVLMYITAACPFCRSAERAADLDRRAPRRRLRRSLFPRTRGQAGPTPRGLAMSEAQQPQASFQIEKIYVKDLSLEIPNAPQVFVQQVQPQVEVQINTAASQFAEAYFEVTVSATVTARVEERTLFLAEAVQAGIFSVGAVPLKKKNPLLGVACPTILVPYLRETISDLIARGGFPPVLLSPISFEALYAQRLQQRQQQQGGEGSRIEVAS